MRILILILTALVTVSQAYAQGPNPAHNPGCTPVVVPLPTDGHAGGITHHLVYAPPPTDAERWGHIEYPINVPFPTLPDGSPDAQSFGLMWLMSSTEIHEGFELLRWGGHQRALYAKMRPDGSRYVEVVNTEPHGLYVLGRSGVAYVWIPGGVRHVWYPIMPNDAPPGVEPVESFRITIDHSDRWGPLSLPLSTVLHYKERVTLGVNVVYPYWEPIRVNVALHYRQC